MITGKRFNLSPATIIAGLVIGGVFIGLTVAMAEVWPIGPDYYYTFRPVTERLIHGEIELYGPGSYGFFYAPWTILLLLPTTWVSLPWGQALFLVTSLTILVFVPYLVKLARPFRAYSWIFALFTLHTFDLLIRVQLDALPLLGVALGWWAIQKRRPWVVGLAFWFMAIKPLNVALAGFVVLIAMRTWTRREQIKALTIPVLSLLLSFPLIGWDWPQRYSDSYQVFSPPKEYLTLTLWRVARNIDFPFWPLYLLAGLLIGAALWAVWRKGMTPLTYSIVLTTNLTLAQYATGNHYVIMIPAVLFISQRNWRLGLLAYGLTWTPLLRAQWGTGIAPIDILYPITLMLSGWYLLWQAEKKERLRRAARQAENEGAV
ncbi:MAG: DUF2029 domain-containing protein [Anaerolineae bacterium]|nr:DUF2029 domain-containing protein [Anaerolineae bacterium]